MGTGLCCHGLASSKVPTTHVKELAPIVIAALVWGQQWKGETVLAQCNNAAGGSGSNKLRIL